MSKLNDSFSPFNFWLGIGLGIGLGVLFTIAYLKNLNPSPATPVGEARMESATQEFAARKAKADNQSKYTKCFFDALQAQADAFNDAARYFPPRALMELQRSLPSPAQTRALIKESCQLAYPCAANEIVSADYNTCAPR